MYSKKENCENGSLFFILTSNYFLFVSTSYSNLHSFLSCKLMVTTVAKDNQ